MVDFGYLLLLLLLSSLKFFCLYLLFFPAVIPFPLLFLVLFFRFLKVQVCLPLSRSWQKKKQLGYIFYFGIDVSFLVLLVCYLSRYFCNLQTHSRTDRQTQFSIVLYSRDVELFEKTYITLGILLFLANKLQKSDLFFGY